MCFQIVLNIYFWMWLSVASMHLQPCLSLQKLLSSFTWAWMPWMLTNGKWPQQREFYASLGIFFAFWFYRLVIVYIITSSHCCDVLGNLGQSFGLFNTLLVLILVGWASFMFPLSSLSNYILKSLNTKIASRYWLLPCFVFHICIFEGWIHSPSFAMVKILIMHMESMLVWNF